MRVPDLGEFIADIVSRIFPQSKVWRGLVVLTCLAIGLFLVGAKLVRHWQGQERLRGIMLEQQIRDGLAADGLMQRIEK